MQLVVMIVFAITLWVRVRNSRTSRGAVAPQNVSSSPGKAPEPGRFTKVLGALVVLGIAYVVGGYVMDWVFPDSRWAIKWRHALDSDLDDPLYVIEKRPHNCEFMSAPMGSKNCHYDRVVETRKIRGHGDARELSVDDGKTWTVAGPTDRSAVYVSWTKVPE